ncbi:uncharacterized protein [Physcomitrium patens]|uniref:Uncharacterized protein n=1 Tax=Physcomitrium patens TaxID=3218 RepID=A0A2K1JUK4_PHYPA|nr:uncharacterized protein LOC112288962 [Physcomitrium patens]PNR45209.1 hypothetical protein PHYPA_014980 [Physcomitrium patens]|eukprot:XP_024389527.1 uncharacterized protein LOC112288962 [Physcomitrella patens]
MSIFPELSVVQCTYARAPKMQRFWSVLYVTTSSGSGTPTLSSRSAVSFMSVRYSSMLLVFQTLKNLSIRKTFLMLLFDSYRDLSEVQQSYGLWYLLSSLSAVPPFTLLFRVLWACCLPLFSSSDIVLLGGVT